MKVAVFDIDGTLTQSSGVDDASFQRAARDLLGLQRISLDWAAYPHSTDDAIAAHLISVAHGRTPRRDEIDAFERGFLGVLDDELARCGGVRPVPGAAGVMAGVRGAGWVPAVATGCWRRSALRKLASANLSLAGIGAAFADDAWPRAQIIALAVRRAMALAGIAGDEQPDVAYVGDGIWDVRACRAGGYRFVGIAEGQRAAALRQEGASTVLANYADERAFLEALQHATVPRNA